MTLMMLPPFPCKKDPLLHLTDLFAKGARGRFWALIKLFFPSCELHVLPVVLSQNNTTCDSSHVLGGEGLDPFPPNPS